MSSCIWNLGFFPNDARKNCRFVLTAFTGGSSERCPGIGFLSRGDREIGVLRNVEPPTRPRLECLRETGLILRCDRKVGNPFQTKQGSRPSRPDQEGRKGSEEGVPENLTRGRPGFNTYNSPPRNGILREYLKCSLLYNPTSLALPQSMVPNWKNLPSRKKLMSVPTLHLFGVIHGV